jgi:hypothetical protein
MNEAAIACSLGPEDYQRRLSAIGRLGEVALLDVEALPDGALLSFQDSDGIRDQLASIVQAEAVCCSFLRLTLVTDADRLTLAISAPPDAMPVVQELTESFQGAVNR